MSNGSAPPTTEDIGDAAHILLTNTAVYAAQLRAANQSAQADAVINAHSVLIHELLETDAQQLQSELSNLAGPSATKLTQVTQNLDAQTTALNHSEAMVQWVLGLADAFVNLFGAAETGAGGIAAAVEALWNQFTARPA
jgi:hypothetical protein